jgi:hypothetical protein
MTNPAMNIRARSFLSFLLITGCLLEAAQPPTAPRDLLNFAGRLAHNHGYLFGDEQQSELETLNRELREADRQIRDARDDAARRAAIRRGATATERLVELVEGNPRLLRLDLRTSQPVLAPAGPFEQPGDSGALLIRVIADGDGTWFSSNWADLSQPRGESSQVTVDLGPGGISYAVVGLENLPVGRTTIAFRFNRAGQASLALLEDVVTPEPGRLRMTVLSDDTGEPAPAMVRLMWRVDGLQRRPSNGIEFAPQFDGQGHASGVRAANLPGPSSSHFWCVPGPFDMTVAPGVWQVGVRRGVEHEVLFQDVTIHSGELTELTLRPRRWVNMRQHGWWSGDDHVHARIVSDDDARNVMAWVQAEGVHLANVVKMGDIYRTYFEQRGFGPEFRVVDGQHVLAPGQECPRTHDQIGHTLAMNITSMIRDPERYFLYDTVFDAVREQGGLTGYAHVNSGLFHVHRDMSLNVPRDKVDFVEILQFNHLGTDLYYEFLNLGCKLTASAGSDVPWGGTIGEVRVYAFLGDEPFNADNWFDAFGRGRTFTTSGPMIEFRVDDALPGDELVVSSDRELRVRARAWSDGHRMGPVQLEIVRHGEVIRSASSTNPQKPEAVLEFTLPAGNGAWIAARARAQDGTSAHTTPVYIVREGLRFWKFDALDDLLGLREGSLRQIEGIIEEARRLDAEGSLETDRYRKLLARQGSALLERVDTAREVYAELRRIADAERTQRESASTY